MSMQTLPGSVIGQAEAERALRDAWQSGRMHHAWLLTGPAGIGKASLAHQFARAVLSAGGDAQAARRAAAGTHADLLVVTRALDEKRQRLRGEIVLDDVRPVAAFLHRTAAEGGWRVVIVDGAEYLNRNAANALLKLIEEPPNRAVFLIVCSAPGRLPATVRSRCRTLRLAPLDPLSIDIVLARTFPDLATDQRHALAALSAGSPGRAVSLAADDGIALAVLVGDTLERHDRRPGLWSYEVADSVLQKDGNFVSFFALMSASIASVIRQGVRSGLAETLLASRPAASWALVAAELARLCREAESLNMDKRQAILTGLGLLSG